MQLTTAARRSGLAVIALTLLIGFCLRSQEPANASPQTPADSAPQVVAPPVVTSSVVAEDGPALFHERGCEYCHGPNAAGTAKGPSLRRVRRQLTKDAIARQIHDGGGGMPPFGEALNAEEIENLVAFLETLKPLPHASGKKSPASATQPAASSASHLAAFLSPMPQVQP